MPKPNTTKLGQVLKYYGSKQTKMGLSADGIGEEAFSHFNKGSKRNRTVRTRIYVLFSHGHA
jgi:hypothetical protein